MLEDIIEDPRIPNDHSRQVTSNLLVKRILLQNTDIHTVMDLGCGIGNSVDFFRAYNPTARWIGLDIANSPEVRSRRRTDAEFLSFHGVNIPFDDNYFDLIYCNQVLEHVRYPIDLLKEVRRVLKPNGYFVGSTSQLEPYHSHSLWNYTFYGFGFIIEEAGLNLLEIRPGIDGLTLIIRLCMGRPNFFSRWWEKESPLNWLLGLAGRVTKKTHRKINFAKLVFCGQFCFLVQK